MNEPGGSGKALVPDADEHELWMLFQRERSSRARDQLFAFYAPYARQIAKRRFHGGRGGDIELPDLCQLAYAGLLEAIDRFDPTRGIPFRGYAGRRISGSILDGISRTSEVRQQFSYRSRVRSERARSLVGDGDQAAEAPAAEAMRAFEELAIGLALGFMLEGTSLYQSEDAPDLRANAYESLAWADCLRQIATVVESLPERERSIIRLHYFEDMDFTQIAAIINVGKSRTSQLHRAAIELLRKRLRTHSDFRLER